MCDPEPHDGAARGEEVGAPTAVVEEDFASRGPVRRFVRAHPWVMDLVVVAIFLLPSVIASTLIGSAWLHFAVTGVIAVALMWRRKYPIALTFLSVALGVASIAVTGAPGDADLAIAFALYAVVTVRGTRLGWLCLAGATLAYTLGLFAWGRPDVLNAVGVPSIGHLQFVVSNVASLLVLWLIAVAIGLNVRNRREQIQRLVDQASQFRLERDQRELLAAASERARIAREMHDVVAHSLSVMVALADGAQASLAKSPERTATALTELSGTGRAALTDMRRILGVLRAEPTDAEAALSPQPGAPALEDLIDRFRATGLEVAYSHTGPPLPEDAGLQLTTYRVVQEGLTNVLRHAPGAGGIAVIVRRQNHAVTITVRNDRPTRPAEARAGSGQGLVGMRQRAAVYDGTVTAGPDGGGWTMTAQLHIPDDLREDA
ncbi:MAG TPA: sensor histidine kinase [Candidatus Ruania gallistercoris]|uniref:histidine kinase n=1 Tax=Candidatus Ruania gallistercoris TaxID=2838746 RepID=A0A9D2J3C0_9MICO|nr:sensor histidine kinase [Candidatus Ruania gallistercoris]